MTAKPPGAKWILILGAAGFAAGFIGPMIFVPEANQGPMVGIFISGPAGVALGAILWGLCSLLKPGPRAQWRMLCTLAALGVVTTLLCVQPPPALLGHVFDGAVQSCEPAADTEESVIDHWEKQIAQYAYAEPRAGWREDMQRQLRDAPGVVITVRMQRQNAIREHRKPWNRGRQFATGWTPQSQDTLFYDAHGTCDRYAEGSTVRGFQAYDADEVLAEASVWPPAKLLRMLGASKMAEVPAKWAEL
ncbi:MAG TPA: hypothetical protein VFS13_07890 [Steroidobacteraceae bacterium]|nr:hypothetical protein [Steroidobacteraceae bacterium]